MPLSRNLGTLTSWNPLGNSRPVTGLLYLYYYYYYYYCYYYTVFGHFSQPHGFAGDSHNEEQYFAKKSAAHISNGNGICSLYDTSWTFVHNEMIFSAQGRVVIQAVNLLFQSSRPVSTPGLCMWDFVVDKVALGDACDFPCPYRSAIALQSSSSSMLLFNPLTLELDI